MTQLKANLSVSTMEYGRTTHFMRNIIGRVTYGVVGLDKLMQNEQSDSKKYLESFLSLISDQYPKGTHKLLPEVEEAISDYNPRLGAELADVAIRVREITREGADDKEISKALLRLEEILNTMYEAVQAQQRSNR